MEPAVQTWAADTRALAEEARLVGADYPATEPGFYVAFELRTTADSLERAAAALEQDERLTALMHTRLIIEIAIRLAWVKAPIKRRDRAAIAKRLRQLTDRDIQVLLAADDAVHRHAGFAMLANRAEILGQVPKPVTNKEDLAPAKLERLAAEAEQPVLYGAYRYTSTLAHPGVGQKIMNRAPAENLWQYLRFGHAAAVLHGVALLDGLALVAKGTALTLNEAAYHGFGRLPSESVQRPG